MNYHGCVERVNALKQLLDRTDYKSYKAYEGNPSGDWEEIRQHREDWRKEIREIEEIIEEPEREGEWTMPEEDGRYYLPHIYVMEDSNVNGHIPVGEWQFVHTDLAEADNPHRIPIDELRQAEYFVIEVEKLPTDSTMKYFTSTDADAGAWSEAVMLGHEGFKYAIELADMPNYELLENCGYFSVHLQHWPDLSRVGRIVAYLTNDVSSL